MDDVDSRLEPDSWALGTMARVRAMRDPVAIVEQAIERPMYFMASVDALRHCEPDSTAARTLVNAHERSEAPSWLVACLLGCNRHPDGYSRALAILCAGDGLLSESYASHALVSIRGERALPDLVAALESSEDGNVRKAAASALGRLGSTRAIDALRAAVLSRRLRGRTVGAALTRFAVPPETLVNDLRSQDRETRRWPAVLIDQRIGRLDDDSVSSHLADCGRCGALRSALATLLDTGDDAVLPGEARRIRAWLYSLAPCDRNGDSPP